MAGWMAGMMSARPERAVGEGSTLFGKESALFLPSGTQSNLAALLTHCERGEEYIVGQEAHTYLYEGGGGACLKPGGPQRADPDVQLCYCVEETFLNITSLQPI